MSTEFVIVCAIISFLIGFIISWLVAGSRSASKIAQSDRERAEFKTKMDFLDAALSEAKEKVQEQEKALMKSLQAQTSAEGSAKDAQRMIEELQKREAVLNDDIFEIQRRLSISENENSALRAAQEATNLRLQEQQQFVAEAQNHLKDAFGALSANALKSNNESFVELAKAKLDEKVVEAKSEFEKKEQAIGALVDPLGKSLEKMDSKIQELEEKRIKAYSDIGNFLNDVKGTTEGLKKETTNLVGALKTSHTRGRYGELALRRLVEHAGMVEHCDFEEQVTVEDEEGGRLRPDMVIWLPGSKTFVVDSKTPLAAYMRMFETEDPDQQKMLLGQHVSAVKEHFRKLSEKAYWNQFDEAPDFVIMYMHIESSYGMALQAWPEMIEEAMKNRIIVATPTILLAILLGVGYSWNQLKTMENIDEIRNAAVELHDRSVVLLEHIGNVGRSLSTTITHYNRTIGSLEGNFLPHARRINGLSQAYIKKQEIPELAPIEASVRPIVALPQAQNVSEEGLPEEDPI
ncbi:DNA recombination protein RmuC [Dinghuibacter silviterrae]|uniref:DNA recombination protein RmuC n=1 Tax=Dinghuibacter silviterrae TaxID=1539049 RepID=A0A4R8DQG7_9BACT|nr:DNA recombination protein RmuC [Dinghuibacter silviterrae]TDX00384.1 DNA recombination protein RmuC [Dinghuibacter silviterrae]